MENIIRIIRPSFEVWTPKDELDRSLRMIERAGKKSHLSETGDAEQFVSKLLSWGHESVLEHRVVTVLIVCDRTCSHQLVRHRIAAYTQESQRYCDYSHGKFDGVLKAILPMEMWDIEEDWGGPFITSFNNCEISHFDIHWRGENILLVGKTVLGEEVVQYVDPLDGQAFRIWAEGVTDDYERYLRLVGMKKKPEDARTLLPGAAKTEVVTTYNLREWRHVFKMRCSKHAQDEIRGIMTNLLGFLSRHIPVVFDDLAKEFVPPSPF
jgi:thymidylate synthase (FAD)